jgi:MEMO1 family protein
MSESPGSQPVRQPETPSSVPGAAAAPKFDPSAPHQQKPKLRPVRCFPAQANGQMLMGMADARQISDKMVLAPMAAQHLLPLMNGERTIGEIVAATGQGLTEAILQNFIAQLDEAALLFGPKFDALVAKMRQDFDSSPVLPPAATAAFADMLVMQKYGQEATEQQKEEHGAALMAQTFDDWIKHALDEEQSPAFDDLPRAIIAPHIDYPRGWLNYASIWGRMHVVDRPDRVVVLGTNHFGMSTGVAVCDKGFQTPLGVCPADTALIEKVRAKLGSDLSARLLEHRYDHEREHSIELQIAWIQHSLGKNDAGEYLPVFAALVHDPSVNNGESYDGKGVGLTPFLEALRSALDELGGRTLIVSSADLSHVGPAFGDQQPLAGEDEAAEQARNRVLSHDQEMLNYVSQGKPDELIVAMAWQQNPTRWCSVGNIAAALKLAGPGEVQILRYMASMDQQGMGMVSSCAAVLK